MSSTVEVGAVAVGWAVTVGTLVAVDVGLTPKLEPGWRLGLDPTCEPACVDGAAVSTAAVVAAGVVWAPVPAVCGTMGAVVVTGGGACVAVGGGDALRVLCMDMNTTTRRTSETPATAPPSHARERLRGGSSIG